MSQRAKRYEKEYSKQYSIPEDIYKILEILPSPFKDIVEREIIHDTPNPYLNAEISFDYANEEDLFKNIGDELFIKIKVSDIIPNEETKYRETIMIKFNRSKYGNTYSIDIIYYDVPYKPNKISYIWEEYDGKQRYFSEETYDGSKHEKYTYGPEKVLTDYIDEDEKFLHKWRLDKIIKGKRVYSHTIKDKSDGKMENIPNVKENELISHGVLISQPEDLYIDASGNQ